MTGPTAPVGSLVTPAAGETIGAAKRPLGGAETPLIQGASPITKGSTVESMPLPASDVKTPPPNCPICHEPATHWGRHSGHGVTVANYVCDNAHGWLTGWVTP